MSNFKSCFTKIKHIENHPDPKTTALEIATVYGFQIVVRKDSFKVGDIVFFTPVDSVLSEDIESLIFPPESKIKLSKGRVRQARIRSFPSQGLIVEKEKIQDFLVSKGFNLKIELEKDISSLVGISKYEPPLPKDHIGTPITSKKRLAEHPSFHKYNGLTNIKWGDIFEEGKEQVVIQTKLHGSNCRAGLLSKKPKNILEKVLKFFNLLPQYEFRYGSNNVDITLKSDKNSGYYGTDIYGRALKDGDIQNKLKPNELVYGEVIGEKIQKNYHYGHKTPHFVLFDVKVFENDNDTKGRWLNPEEVETFAKERDIPMVPVIYKGIYSKNIADSLVSGKDDYYPEHIKEGIVIKSVDNYNDILQKSNKRARKYINPQYLDKDNSDFH